MNQEEQKTFNRKTESKLLKENQVNHTPQDSNEIYEEKNISERNQEEKSSDEPKENILSGKESKIPQKNLLVKDDNKEVSPSKRENEIQEQIIETSPMFNPDEIKDETSKMNNKNNIEVGSSEEKFEEEVIEYGKQNAQKSERNYNQEKEQVLFKETVKDHHEESKKEIIKEFDNQKLVDKEQHLDQINEDEFNSKSDIINNELDNSSYEKEFQKVFFKRK